MSINNKREAILRLKQSRSDLAIMAACSHYYRDKKDGEGGWDNKYRAKKIDNLITEKLSWKNSSVVQDVIDEFTAQDFIDLDFRPWDEPDENGIILYLMPIYYLPVIDEDVEVITIHGKSVKIKDLSDDVSEGYLSGGFRRQVPVNV